LDQLNYVLGVNAHAISFLTGIGEYHTMNPHHRPSGADNIAEPVPGLLAGGPDEFLEDGVLVANFTPSTPPALCYIDDVGSYASNEIAVNWNSALVFAAAYFANPTFSSIEEKESRVIPRRIGLLQNYPNPFNGSTTFRFVLAAAQSAHYHRGFITILLKEIAVQLFKK
jgi:endoglucanase